MLITNLVLLQCESNARMFAISEWFTELQHPLWYVKLNFYNVLYRFLNVITSQCTLICNIFLNLFLQWIQFEWKKSCFAKIVAKIKNENNRTKIVFQFLISFVFIFIFLFWEVFEWKHTQFYSSKYKNKNGIFFKENVNECQHNHWFQTYHSK